MATFIRRRSATPSGHHIHHRVLCDTLDTTTSANSARTATTVDATAGALASDLAALAVDAKTRAEIKAIAPLLGSADLTGLDKPPERASYLTKDAFAAAARKWLAMVKARVQKLIQQAAGGGGKGRGSSKGNGARGNTTTVGEIHARYEGRSTVEWGKGHGLTVDGSQGPQSGLHSHHHQGPRQAACAGSNPSSLPLISLLSPSNFETSRKLRVLAPIPLLSLLSPSSLPTPPLLPPPDRRLGYVPPPSTDPAKQPNLNTVSRYLTVGLTLDRISQKLTWDFKKNVDHSKLFTPDDEFDQGNCGAADHSKLFTPDDEFDQGNCDATIPPPPFPSALPLSQAPAGRTRQRGLHSNLASPTIPPTSNLFPPPPRPGSCWAYAAARAVQGAYAKLKETDDDVFPSGMRLSVQQLLDCTGAAATCRGGYPEAALQYAAKIGLQDEAEYAYTGDSGKCSVKKDAVSWNGMRLPAVQHGYQAPRPLPE
ncbi:unnamed protein product [Closterium sp. Yama58-4]|nr:unnamed protein product [Closterium sp. Yama58-4]